MKAKIEWKNCLKIGISIFVLYLCIHYWSTAASFLKTVFSATAPLLIGCVLAYPLNILMSFYEKHWFPNSQKPSVKKSRAGICLVLAILTLAAVISLILVLVVPQLVECVKLLIAEVPDAVAKVVEFLKKYDFAPQELIEKLSSIDWKSRIGDIAKTVTSGIGNVMDVAVSAVSSVVSGVTTASLAIIFSVYVLLNKEKLKNQITKLIKRFIRQDIYDKGAYVLSVVNDCFHRFIVGQCTEAVILGALCAIGMLILKLPYALMMGAVTAFTALIPVVGALIGGAIGAFLILMQSPVKALIFLVFIILLQQIEGDLIYPRVVGNSIGLPGIWVFVAVTVGGGVLGVFGMMLGVPVAAAAYRLLKAEVNKTKTCAPEKTE